MHLRARTGVAPWLPSKSLVQGLTRGVLLELARSKKREREGRNRKVSSTIQVKAKLYE